MPSVLLVRRSLILCQPALYCRANFASTCGMGDSEQRVKFAKGTTTLAFKFNGGIIVSVDSRATQGGKLA
jgi:20S proteasome subunit beta 5